jgi:hypothetical protein
MQLRRTRPFNFNLRRTQAAWLNNQEEFTLATLDHG